MSSETDTLPLAAKKDGYDFFRTYLLKRPIFYALVRGVECRLFANLGRLEQPILDLGCGDGFFAATAFSEKIFAGLDPDFENLEKARKQGIYEHITAGEGKRLPF